MNETKSQCFPAFRLVAAFDDGYCHYDRRRNWGLWSDGARRGVFRARECFPRLFRRAFP